MEEQRCRKTNDRRCSDQSFWRCAAIFFPYLNPIELISVSSTCKTLYQISKAVTSRRISDGSRGFEKLPTSFHNPTSADPYFYFLYTPTQTLRATSDFRQPWGSDHDAPSDPPDPFLYRVEGANGCECADACVENCTCLNLECGPSCECGPGCRNRVTQSGITVKLKIVKDEKKGWGLHAAELIPAGQFVCEYAGEVLSTKEARARQQKYDEAAAMGRSAPALLVVKEHLPWGNTCMRINIDATRIGNVARFINHSCDGGNLDTVIVRSAGALLPRVCFFASTEIEEDEELTFSYGYVKVNTDDRPCFCGSDSCAGILPSEDT